MNFKSSARVVDGTLILSLPDAVMPVVWQMELSATKSSALEVRPQDNGNFMLTLKTPRGDVHDVAPFATKNAAVQALMAASHAMTHAHGQLRPAANDGGRTNLPALLPPPAAQSVSGRGRMLAAVVGIALLAGLVVILLNTGPRRADSLGEIAPASSASAPAAAGTPLSADEFLRGR